jgi:hypothetical protein
MLRDSVDPELSALAFEFFYWYSRLEFALKESGYLKNHSVGARAEPGWSDFVLHWSSTYEMCAGATALVSSAPRQQTVGDSDALKWEAVNLDDCTSDLARVVRLLKTVRNNLFHGGKHGAQGWDQPEQTRAFLSAGRTVLDSLAKMAALEADYTRRY